MVSKIRLTESIKRGIINESNGIKCIRSLNFVVFCFKNGMFDNQSTKLIGVSLDGIVFLDFHISKGDLYGDTELSENKIFYISSKLE